MALVNYNSLSTFLFRKTSPQQPKGLEQAHGWRKWIWRFEGNRIASGLTDKPHNEQVSALLYSTETCADDILTTLKIDESKLPSLRGNENSLRNILALEEMSLWIEHGLTNEYEHQVSLSINLYRVYTV